METTIEQEVTDAEMRAIQDAIFSRFGINFYNYEPKSFKRRIMRVYRKFNFKNSLDLWSRALKDPEFIHDFINEISVGLTSMFRDPLFWVRVRDILAVKFKEKDPIRIWHAGCSSGEEVYTLGIILKNLKLQDNAKAMATDFCSNALRQAEKGLIHEAKLAEYEKNYSIFAPLGKFENFISQKNDHFQIDPEIYKHTHFRNANLIMEDIKAVNEFDIIFCRNVLIYFENSAKLKVIEGFYKALKPGGLFIVGFFDSVINLLDNNKFECFDLENRIFRKIG